MAMRAISRLDMAQRAFTSRVLTFASCSSNLRPIHSRSSLSLRDRTVGCNAAAVVSQGNTVVSQGNTVVSSHSSTAVSAQSSTPIRHSSSHPPSSSHSPSSSTPQHHPLPPSTAASTITASQRLNRPIAPHLAIYRPQINSVTSILERITGSILSVSLYGFGTAYLASRVGVLPEFDSASLAEAFGGLPGVVKGGVKFLVAWPFTFHVFNGVRYFVFDAGVGFKNTHHMRSGWLVLGGSVVMAGVLAVM